MISRKRLALIVLLFSVLVYVGASMGMIRNIEPLYSWYYCFAWWALIFALESVLYLSDGDSELYQRPRDFVVLLPLSVVCWLVFEAFNFRLGNWFYHGVPAAAAWRWGGYTIAFATVLPGVFGMARLLEHMGLFRRVKVEPYANAKQLHGPLFFTGLLFLVLPLAFPRFFFPLVWGGVVLLLEPWLHANGGRSLLGDWERGDPRRFLLLLLAGFICGGLWEFWNFHAGAKWIYEVPFVGDLKIFEMPVLGFLGFPPFAVECYVMANAFLLLRERLADLPDGRRQLYWALIAMGIMVFSMLVMAGMDRWTVLSFRHS